MPRSAVPRSAVPPRIFVPEHAELAIRYACVEVFPRESFGWLVGLYPAENTWHVQAAVPTQIVSGRSRWHVEAHDDSERAQDLVIDDHTIGDFHSHPNGEGCAPSHHDREDMLSTEPDGKCFLIAAIHPSRKHPAGFHIKLGGYVVLNGRIRRATIARPQTSI